ncbi:hypothetical protein LRP52_32865 [Photobacterium sp. ZSDE20]|uniref:Outer membrane protein beta-barrel domain-containing protein n=1 Tax=Photobacterium pectinilyticum TaxID=2906793 RepID=A0ABT1N5M1_9GAMM|nr:hypothetical protein [Photobacterium sp. ZSDE20]MCQ1060045.1 hypothetical protein [Photobacterium sp. ZSDE20]MDD1826978.1 hypothetical protein [Photobacterium sp. ZSDE20]
MKCCSHLQDTILIIFLLIIYPASVSAETDYFVGGGVGYQNDRLDGASSTNGEDAFVQLKNRKYPASCYYS